MAPCLFNVCMMVGAKGGRFVINQLLSELGMKRLGMKRLGMKRCIGEQE